MSNNLPENAVRIFNNQDVSNWTQRNGDVANWAVKDGVMSVNKGDIMTQERFTDFFLHLEFMTPDMPDATGQAKGNSGVFLQGRYEIQLLDSYGKNKITFGDNGGIYQRWANG